MRVIVAGLGVQGYKRKRFAGDDFVASVDPINNEADVKDIKDIPLDIYDAALLCVPDGPKIELLTYLFENGKHALVEKPLAAPSEAAIQTIETLARKNHVVCYTAYNHRFEPHFVKMREIIESGALGEIYRCRMFYGNGTARLVRNSAWRDSGAGVLPDLGSHLLDTAAFWFGDLGNDFDVISADTFENAAADHVVIGSQGSSPRLEMEMTLLMWRNHFTCDIFAEKGTAHIESLCKWGPSSFIIRSRILPSGRPPEHSETLVQDDPTWETEYAHFKSLCQDGHETDLTQDRWLMRVLSNLSDQTMGMVQE